MKKSIKNETKESLAHLENLCRDPSVSCLVLAHEVVSAYKRLKDTSCKGLLSALCSKEMKAERPSLYKAGKRIALKLEEDLSASHHGNTYHNVEHLKKVLINTFVLSQVSQRMGSQPPSVDLFVAAIIHDADHDGGTNSVEGKHKPFHLEDRAMAYVLPLLKEEKVDKQTIHTLHAMLRWTDLEGRAEAMAKAYPEGLAPAVAEKAKILGDADLLAAIGLTGRQAYQEDRKLGLEQGRPFSARAFQSFVESVAGEGFQSKGGQYFNPNIEGVIESMNAFVVKRYNTTIALTLSTLYS